jgi:RNA polymerase sigma factor (sigma-70 family)
VARQRVVQRTDEQRAGEPTGEQRPDERPTLVALYRERGPAMVRLAHLLTGDNAAAQDVVHDAFIKVSAKLDGVEHGAAPIEDVRAYLRRVVVNECHGWHRRAATRARHEPPVAEPIVRGPELDEVWSAIAELPPQRRTALVLRFYEDLSLDEVAAVMGVRPATARSLVRRGLASLRKVVER